MKKLGLLVMPLLAISFLASCNNKNNWWNKTRSLTKDDIGKIEEVKINGLMHKVRLIDVDRDVDKNGNKIHTTWEFVNLISDKEGYSLATQWNDTVDKFGSYDYLNSSMRRTLNKKGNGHILWARYNATSWDNSADYKNKSALDMLPRDLVNVLVAPKKEVMCKEGENWISKEIKDEKGEFDKLFLLSPEEMNCSNVEEILEEAYTYYREPDLSKKQLLRIKKQINGDKIIQKESKIPEGSGQTYKDYVINLAGWNNETDKTGGGEAWTRSPITHKIVDYDYYLNYLTQIGTFSNHTACPFALAIAPAFCI